MTRLAGKLLLIAVLLLPANSGQCRVLGIHRKASSRRSRFPGREGRKVGICIWYTGFRRKRQAGSGRLPSADETSHGQHDCHPQGFWRWLGSCGENERSANAFRRLRRDEPYLCHLLSRRKVSRANHGRRCRATASRLPPGNRMRGHPRIARVRWHTATALAIQPGQGGLPSRSAPVSENGWFRIRQT